MHPLHCPHILTSLGNLTVTRTGRPDFSQKDGKSVCDQPALWDQIIIYTYHPNFANGIFTKNEETLEKTPQLVYLASLVSTS